MALNKKIIVAAMAIALTGPVMAEEIDDVINQQFLEAINMRDSGDLFASIEMLEKLIAAQPEYKRAELELAVAYFRATLFDQAKAHAEKVLADPKTPVEVKDTIQVFLTQLADQQAAEAEDRHKFEGAVGIGFGRDSNVNASPADELVDINGLQFTLAEESIAQTENYGTVSAQITHQYKIPGRFDIGSRPVKGLWNTTVAGYRKAFRDLGEYTLNVATFQTGLGLISATNWRAGVNFRYDHIELGGDRLGAFRGVNGNYTFIDGANQFTFNGEIIDQVYDSDANKGRQGIKKAMGASVQRQIKPNLAATLGYDIARNEAKEDNKQYFSRKMQLGLFYAMSPQTLLYGQASYQTFDYNGVEAVYNTARNDRQKAGTIGMSHTFKSGMLEDWKLNGKMTRYINDSDISIYEYTRTDTSVELNKNF